MRAFTTKTKIVAVDMASKAFKDIARSSATMAKSIKVNTKRAVVSLNIMNAKVNQVARNAKKKFAGIKSELGMLGMIGFAGIAMLVGSMVMTFANFEQANVNLASVMGKTIGETKNLQADAKKLGATTAKTATEVVALQESLARLGFESPDIINMTGAIISGSVAMQGELAETADLAGATVKTFKEFGSVDTPKIMDIMTLATQKSALNFRKLQVALPIVGATANAAGIKFSKVAASLGILADSGLDASSSATAYKKIIAVSAKSGIPMEKSLLKIANSSNKVKTAFELFGLTAGTQAIILADNIDKVNGLDSALIKSGGTAEKTAARQLDTLMGSVTILGSAWEGFVLSLEDGNGAFSKFLKKSVRVVTDLLSLATGTALASDKLDDYQLGIRNTANNIIIALKAVGLFVIALVALKTIMVAIAVYQFAYNVVLGVSAALAGGAALATDANTVAQISYKIAMVASTAATWLLTTAMTALNAVNPVAWIILGVIALIALISTIIIKWDAFKASIISAGEAVYEFFGGDLDLEVKVKTPKKADYGNLVETQKGNENNFVSKNLVSFESGIDGGGVLNLKSIEEKKLADEKNKVEFKRLISEQKQADALAANTTQLNANNKTAKAQKQWSGKFSTSILKDANLGGGLLASQSLASSAVNSQITNSIIQRQIINGNTEKNSTLPTESISVASSQRNISRNANNNKSTNGTININVIDKTGGKFGIEIDNVGVEAIITGNG